MIKKTRVIAGFPGVGKSFFRISVGSDKSIRVSDSDSSKFHWIVENGIKKENPNFISDYMNHIKSLLLKVDIVFVSTHKDVLKALENEGICFTIIYPDRSLKDEFLRRYKRRKSSESFIELLDSKFNEWIDIIESEYLNIPKIKLVKPDEYLLKEELLKCNSVNIESVKDYNPKFVFGNATYQKNENAEERENHNFYAGIQERADLEIKLNISKDSSINWNAYICWAKNIIASEFLEDTKDSTVQMVLFKSEFNNGNRIKHEKIVFKQYNELHFLYIKNDWVKFLDSIIESLYDEVRKYYESNKNIFIVDEYGIAFQNFSNYGNRIIESIEY